MTTTIHTHVKTLENDVARRTNRLGHRRRVAAVVAAAHSLHGCCCYWDVGFATVDENNTTEIRQSP